MPPQSGELCHRAAEDPDTLRLGFGSQIRKRGRNRKINRRQLMFEIIVKGSINAQTGIAKLWNRRYRNTYNLKANP